MKKISLVIIVIILAFNHIPIESSISTVSFPLWDHYYDVVKIENGTNIGIVNKPSIDILAVCVDVHFSQIKIKFSDSPIIDYFHAYMVDIVWDFPYNKTFCYAGCISGPLVANGSSTRLVNLTHDVVNETLYGHYAIENDILIFGNISLHEVTNPIYPFSINVTSVFYELETNTTTTTGHLNINELRGKPVRCFSTDGAVGDEPIVLTRGTSLGGNVFHSILRSIIWGVLLYSMRKRKK